MRRILAAMSGILIDRALATLLIVIGHNKVDGADNRWIKRALQHTLVHDYGLGDKSLMVMFSKFLTSPEDLQDDEEWKTATERVGQLQGSTHKQLGSEMAALIMQDLEDSGVIIEDDDQPEPTSKRQRVSEPEVAPDPDQLTCECQLCQEWITSDEDCRNFIPDDHMAQLLVANTNRM